MFSYREKKKWEQWGFYLVLAMAMASCISTGAMSVGIVLSSLCFLAQRRFTGEWPFIDGKILAAFGIYFFMNLTVAAFSLDPRVSLRVFGSELYRVFPFFFAAAYLRTERQFQSALLVFGLSVCVNDFVGLFQFFRGLWEGSRWIEVRGMNGSHTHFASQILLSLPIFVFCGLHRSFTQRARYFFGGAFFLGCVLLILCQTRGAWLAFAGTIMMVGILDARWRKASMAGIAATIGVFILLAVFYAPMQARLSSILDTRVETRGANTERFLMWQSAAAIWRDYPVHGVGQDMFGLVYNTQYISPDAVERPKNPDDPDTGHGHPHNNFLKVLSEGGIIGILAAIGLHGYFVYRLWLMHKADKNRMAMTFGLAGILMLTAIALEGVTDTNMNQHPIIRTYWLVMGMLFAGARLAKSEGKRLC